MIQTIQRSEKLLSENTLISEMFSFRS